MIAGQRSGQWPRLWESRKGDKAGATRRGPCQQHALWASKSAHKRTEVFSVSLAMRFVGRHTSFFWKYDIRAEAMTWAGIPRSHRMESGSDSV